MRAALGASKEFLHAMCNSVKGSVGRSGGQVGQGTGFRFIVQQFSGELLKMDEMRLYGPAGKRLYLNAEERAALLAVARRRPTRPDPVERSDLGHGPLTTRCRLFDG